MKNNLNDMNEEELGELFPIEIVPYDTEWERHFLEEKDTLIGLLGSETALKIEHMGSTSIPGMSAKPTIDILVEIPESAVMSADVVDIMTRHGYHYIPRYDSPPPYMMCVKGYTPHGIVGQSYHIHMGPADHDGLWDRIFFRDFLRENTVSAREYESLKKELARKYRNHREKYTEGKTSFVEKTTAAAKAQFQKKKSVID
jgi:GrpB-like predicted nucleotidyltransferase (UPF0157 family)